MNTTAAAREARVTVATIRTWCRNGVITATKQAGRWTIDTASLTRRIAIGLMKRPEKKAIVFTVETMTAIGGRRWQKNGMDRIYFNDDELGEYLGLDVSYYNSGNVCGATFQGRDIANGRVAGIQAAIGKVYFDVADGRLHTRSSGDARAYEIRFHDGQRQTFDLVGMVFAGIRAAVAAL